MRVLTLLFTAAILTAQIPLQDGRNTDIPNTDTHAKLPEFKTLREWELRKAELRKQILSATGLYPMPQRGALHAEVFGRLQRDGYTIEKVLLETMPGYYLGGNLYRPLNGAAKHPGILNPHGHWQYGRLENTDVFSGQALGANLAQQGYVVFAYDMVGYNDTPQTPHKFGTPAEQLWSFGPLQLQLWNSLKATDFVAGLSDVDPARLGVTGASGGGTQAFLLTAVDDRISFAAPVNMVSAIMQGGDFCENAPGLRVNTNNVEIAALFAPKPMLLVSATGDWTRNVPREEFPAIQRIYDLYGKRENVEVIQIDAHHNFNQQSREGVYRFFAKRMLNQPDAPVAEKHLPVEMLQDMLALHGRKLPDNAIDYAGVYRDWQALSASAEFTRDRLQQAIGAEWPSKVTSENGAAGSLVLNRAGTTERIPAVLIEGKGLPVLVIDPRGAAVARQSPTVLALIRQKRRVLLIDAFQTGSAVAPRDRSYNHFLTFNRSDDACRVQDILTAAAFLGGPVEVLAFGDAIVWSYFASAIAPVPLKLTNDLSNFNGNDDDFLHALNIPGVQRAGGLSGARALLKNSGASLSHGLQ